MKILQLSTLDIRGGAAMVSWGLQEKLNERGIDCHTLVKHKFSKSIYVKEIGLNYLQKISSKLFSNDIDLGVYRRVLNDKYYKEADIIHCHNLHGPFVNISLLEEISKEKPIVWTLHDMWSITGHCAHSFDCGKYKTGCNKCPYLQTPPPLLWDNTKYLWSEKKNIYQNSKLNIVVPSVWLRNKLRKSILSDKPIQVINNGVDTSIFKPLNKSLIRRKLGLPLDKKIICFVAYGGRNNPWKGVEYLDKVINTFANRNTIFLHIGGRNKNISMNILSTGYIADRTILNEYYTASDIFVFTSIAENFPLVTLEAMSAGLPVVSFDVGGVSEVLNHKDNGYLVKYLNEEDLIRGVSMMINISEEKRNIIRKRNSDKIKKDYFLKKMVAEYSMLYRKLL